MGNFSSVLLVGEQLVAGYRLLVTRLSQWIDRNYNSKLKYMFQLEKAASQVTDINSNALQIFPLKHSGTRIFLLLPFLIWGVVCCAPGKKKPSDLSGSGDMLPVTYAKGFTISNHGKYRKVTVLDPWQKSSGIQFEYYLVDRDKEIPADLAGKQVIRTPVKRVICLSTSHIGFLSALNEIPSLKALSGAGFVSDPEVLKAVASKTVFDVGYDQGINYELIPSLKPDLIIAYGVGGEVTGFINKLRDLGLNVIPVSYTHLRAHETDS